MLVSDPFALSNDFLFCWVQGLDCHLIVYSVFFFPKGIVGIVHNALGVSWWVYNAVILTYVIVIRQVEMSDFLRPVLFEIELVILFNVIPQDFNIVVSVGPALVAFFFWFIDLINHLRSHSRKKAGSRDPGSHDFLE